MNLDRQSLGIIISRILGIYILVQAIGYFAFVSTYFRNSKASLLELFPASVGFFATLGLSYFFLAHSAKAGRFLMSETQNDAKSGTVDQAAILRTAFLIIGGFLIVQAIPALVNQVALYFQRALVGPNVVAHLVESIARLLIGLFLVIGGESWQRLLRKLRN